MRHSTANLESGDAVSLFYQSWMPEAAPRAIVIIVHGITEHCGRYDNVIQPLLSIGIGVYGFDLRGHGKSSGHRGHLDRWQDYRSDLDLVISLGQKQHPCTHTFLLGHSLGSLIVLSQVIEHPRKIAGAIIIGIAADPVGVARPHLVAMAKAFSVFWPKFPIHVRTEGRNALSRDPRVELEFRADPLVLNSVTARLGSQALNMIAAVKRQASRVTLPLLMIHGGSDPLNSVAGAQQFFKSVNSSDKQLLVYEGGLHEPHNDLDRDKVLADLSEWITARL